MDSTANTMDEVKPTEEEVPKETKAQSSSEENFNGEPDQSELLQMLEGGGSEPATASGNPKGAKRPRKG